jgi:hypothetical protein
LADTKCAVTAKLITVPVPGLRFGDVVSRWAVDFQSFNSGNRVEIAVIVVKLDACLQTRGRDNTIDCLAYGELSFAAVSIDVRRMFERSQAAYPENGVGPQDFPGPTEFFVVEDSLKHELNTNP